MASPGATTTSTQRSPAGPPWRSDLPRGHRGFLGRAACFGSYGFANARVPPGVGALRFPEQPPVVGVQKRAAPCCFLEVLVLLSLRSSFLACVPSAGTRDGLSRARKNSAESSLRRVIGWRTLDALSASPAFERGFPVPPCVVRCCVLLEGVTTLLAANQKGPNSKLNFLISL